LRCRGVATGAATASSTGGSGSKTYVDLVPMLHTQLR
jgi:hypothetical protein